MITLMDELGGYDIWWHHASSDYWLTAGVGAKGLARSTIAKRA